MVENRIIQDLYSDEQVYARGSGTIRSRVPDTRLTLRSADMSVVHLGRKLQAGQRLRKVSLQRADHDEHERLGVSTERELKQICELENVRIGDE